MQTIEINISPCPNDTFMFEAMLAGRVDTEGLAFEVRFADIEQLNEGLLTGKPLVSKVSCALLPEIADRYLVLDSGSALGHGNGPLLVGRDDTDIRRPGARIAVPGMHTTARLLLARFFPEITHPEPVLFSEVAGRVASGEFDAGVLIHEGRFTYAREGLRLLADLGEMWERSTGGALPLGSIVVSRRVDGETRARIDRVLRRSVEYALADPGACAQFVRSHAREMDPEVIRSHIELFVNNRSVSLGREGRTALAALTGVGERELFGEGNN